MKNKIRIQEDKCYQVLFMPGPCRDGVRSGVDRYIVELTGRDWPEVRFAYCDDPTCDESGVVGEAKTSRANPEHQAAAGGGDSAVTASTCLSRFVSAVFLALGYLSQTLKLARHIRSHVGGCDLIHVNRVGCEFQTIAARLASRKTVLATVHNLPGIDKKALHPVRRCVEWLSFRCAHHLIAVSEQTRDDWVTRIGVRPHKFTVIYNGMDIPAALPSREEARQRFDVPEDVFCVGICARLHRMKGHGVLFNALSALKKTTDYRLQTADPSQYPISNKEDLTPNEKSDSGSRNQSPSTQSQERIQLSAFNVQLLVAGEGPLEAELKRQVRDLGLEECVRFLGHVNDPLVFLRALDVQVLPAVELECLPYSIVEGMHCGVPSIVSDVGGAKEIVGASGGGVVVPAGDVSALADGINSYAVDPDRIAMERANAKMYASEKLMREKMVRETLNVYRELLCD